MGNRFVPALVDQQPSQLPRTTPTRDDINPIISQYNVRWYVPYLSGAATLSALENNGPWGVPYWMQSLPIQTTNNDYITTPEPVERSRITHRVDPLSNAGQAPVGQAPTKGVYTGVEDHC